MKLYTLDNQFIQETDFTPDYFTGIVELGSGTKHWYLNGKIHRIGKPAIEYFNGTKRWFFNGEQVSEKQYELYVDVMKLKGLL